MTNTIMHILLVDDHTVMRKGLSQLIESRFSKAVFYEAADGVEALEVLKKNKVDIVLTDITMPNMNGIELTKNISEKYPEVKVMVISMHLDEIYIKKAIEAGASGYLSKSMEDENEILDGIEKILAESVFYDKKTSQILIKGMFTETARKLSPKEIEIAQHLSDGLVYKEIAHKMSISPRTVETYRRNLLEKLHLKTTADIIKYAIKNGLVSLD